MDENIPNDDHGGGKRKAVNLYDLCDTDEDEHPGLTDQSIKKLKNETLEKKQLFVKSIKAKAEADGNMTMMKFVHKLLCDERIRKSIEPFEHIKNIDGSWRHTTDADKLLFEWFHFFRTQVWSVFMDYVFYPFFKSFFPYPDEIEEMQNDPDKYVLFLEMSYIYHHSQFGIINYSNLFSPELPVLLMQLLMTGCLGERTIGQLSDVFQKPSGRGLAHFIPWIENQLIYPENYKKPSYGWFTTKFDEEHFNIDVLKKEFFGPLFALENVLLQDMFTLAQLNDMKSFMYRFRIVLQKDLLLLYWYFGNMLPVRNTMKDICPKIFRFMNKDFQDYECCKIYKDESATVVVQYTNFPAIIAIIVELVKKRAIRISNQQELLSAINKDSKHLNGQERDWIQSSQIRFKISNDKHETCQLWVLVNMLLYGTKSAFTTTEEENQNEQHYNKTYFDPINKVLKDETFDVISDILCHKSIYFLPNCIDNDNKHDMAKKKYEKAKAYFDTDDDSTVEITSS